MTNAAVTGASVRSQDFGWSTVGGTTYYSITDAMGRTTKYRQTTGAGPIAGITLPGHTAEDVTVAYAGTRVSSITTAAGSTHYVWSPDSGNVRTVTVTDPGGHATIYTFDIASQRMATKEDALLHTTHYYYDGSGRLTKVVYPEGNYVQYTLDARGNIKETRQVSKTPGTPADIVITADYPATCSNAATCNEPSWTKDALGNQTDYTYDLTTGEVLTVAAPAPATGGARPTTTYIYTSVGGMSLPQTITTCATAATCAGTANETKTTIAYNSNGLPTSVTEAAGDGSVSATTTATYDDVGNVTTIDGPLAGTADTTTYRYDADREVTGVISADPDGSGPRIRRATRLAYNGNGQVSEAEVGTVTGTDDTAWEAFVTKQQLTTSYDAYGRKVRDAVTAGGTTYGVTDYSYDSAGRPDCTTVRMNTTTWGTATAACTGQTAGSAGPDRISKVATYDALNRATSVTTAYGQTEASTESTSFTANGKVASVTDGEGNKTTYSYDGFDRLAKTQYPSPTKGSGTSSTTDYEQLGYDANGNVTSRRLRDGISIGYNYDGLNRLISKTTPGNVYQDWDVTYQYDLLGRLTQATGDGWAVNAFAYDALGRLTTEQNYGGTSYRAYDSAGRQTRLTWSDGFYVDYDYDILGEMTAVRENGATSGVGVLAMYSYDDLGNRTGAVFGNGTATSWAPDPIGRLATLTHDLGGTTNDLTKTFTYNPAGQIASSSSSNDAYAWDGAVNVDRNYTANGLNQYTVSGTMSLGYDGRGNLTSSAGTTYAYTDDNRLASTSTGVLMAYEPAGGQLLQLYTPSLDDRFTWSGDRMIAETNAATGQMLRRYVYGPGTDEPIVQYTGSGTTSRNWLMTDERGSIVALTDSAGNKFAIDTYDEYGIPGTGNGGRFQYTGQEWLPELGLYYYKARMYSPSLGRFMQTDPIGYADGLNWYNYVGGDPINFVDPYGTLKDIVVSHPRWDWRPFLSQLRRRTDQILDDITRRLGGGSTRDIVVIWKKERRPRVCYGPPKGPEGSSATELAAQAKLNGDQAAQHSASDLGWFKSQVQNNGPWDYKQYDRGFQDYGNYNYGYTGSRQGIPAPILRAGAGYAQVRAGTSSPKFITSSFDDPRDQEQIDRGISDAENGCY